MKTLLVIDNYDSFTHNLVQMFMPYDINIRVFRNDRISPDQARIEDPDYLLISPGPGNPSQTGVSIPLLRIFMKKIPVLGICLGMQCINEMLGGRTRRAPEPVHGKTSMVFHSGGGLFRGSASPFPAARYHSLITDPVSTSLVLGAWTEDGIPMALFHPELPLFGLQFHPESFMTEGGAAIIGNFLSYGEDRVCQTSGVGDYAERN